MTREEAKGAIIKAITGDIEIQVIDQIFDEHEAELKQAYIDGSNSNNGLIQFYLKTIEAQHKTIETMHINKGITFCAKCSKELIKDNA